MEIILDTHAFIWFVENDSKLDQSTKNLIEEKFSRVYISIASLWEMAIKMQLNKLIINKSIEEVIDDVDKNGFQILPILPEHIISLSKLEFYHRDPFDRIIIAQAKSENRTIISKDKEFLKYDIPLIKL